MPQVFKQLALASLIALTSAGCKDGPTDDRRAHPGVEVIYDYRLSLPGKFKRQQVHGIDSKVEEWRSADTIIGTDFGHYSAPPECFPNAASCRLQRERIAGRASLVALYRYGPEQRSIEPKPFRVFVHVPVDESKRLRLNLFASCDSEAACQEALTHFRRVLILREERPRVPWDGRHSPPPPPPPPPVTTRA